MFDMVKQIITPMGFLHGKLNRGFIIISSISVAHNVRWKRNEGLDIVP